MKKRVFFILIFLFSSLAASKTAVLPDLMKPGMITADKKSLFVTENYDNSILVFSLSNFNQTIKFGKKGEGPGEFKNIPLIFLKGKEIHVTNPYKYYRFSKTGTLLEEKGFGFMGVFRMAPLGDNYAVSHWIFFPNAATEVSLLNSQLEKVKNLYRHEKSRSNTKKPMKLIAPEISISTSSSGRLYIANPHKGFYIEVYDSEGNLLKTINQDYKKIKIDKSRQERIKEKFMSIPFVKQRQSYFKKRRYAFPEFFPAIEDILISEEKIYVRTFRLQDGKQEYLILDKDGKLIKSLFLPASEKNHYTIANGTFYCLWENDALEQWEVHSTAL